MAIGTGNLPYQISTVSPFDIILAQTTNETIANINALATGTGLGDNSVTADKLAVNAVTGNDGWISTSDTWTYASASTFTVSGDKTGIYTKGTRLKWTQTTVRYGVVVNSSYSAPNTTVTIAVNTDFVIANATISDNFYSYSANPQGYPGQFNYTPTLTSSGTVPTFTTVAGSYSIVGRTITLMANFFHKTGGTAGSGSNPLYFVLPITSSSSQNVLGGGAAYNGVDSMYVLTSRGGPTNIYFNIPNGSNLLDGQLNNNGRQLFVALTYMF